MLPINLLPDGRVLLFMIAVVFLSGIGFGLAPALRASRGELRASVSRHRYRLSRTLVAAQVALSLLLLIGAGLLVRSPNNLHNIDLRFRPEHVLIFELAHNASKRDPASLAGVAEQAYHCVNQVAGVRSASFSAVLLFSPSDVSSAVHIEGYPPGEKRENPLQRRFAAIFQNGGDVPLVQLTRSLRSLEVRTTQPASAIAGPVRQALLEVSKDIMIRRVIALREHVDRTLSSERMIATLCSFFGVLALILASIGLYGVMSYAVAQRTSEIGIRMALGAFARSVLGLVLQQSLLVVGIGIMTGVALAQASTRLLANFLYGLSPTDLTAIASATLLLLGVALLATWLPARRAARVDPMTALRYE